VKEAEMCRAYSTNGGVEECMEGIGGKARRKEPLRRPRRRWADKIELDLREIGWGGI
jgi:hypothetical protein